MAALGQKSYRGTDSRDEGRAWPHQATLLRYLRTWQCSQLRLTLGGHIMTVCLHHSAAFLITLTVLGGVPHSHTTQNPTRNFLNSQARLSRPGKTLPSPFSPNHHSFNTENKVKATDLAQTLSRPCCAF